MHKKEYIPRRKPLGFDTSSLMMLCQGNPGALRCLTELYHKHQQNPYSVEYVLIMLDDLDLKGTKLYMLWNDCLDRNTDRLIRLAELLRDKWITDEQIKQYMTPVRGTPIPKEIYGVGGRICQI